MTGECPEVDFESGEGGEFLEGIGGAAAGGGVVGDGFEGLAEEFGGEGLVAGDFLVDVGEVGGVGCGGAATFWGGEVCHFVSFQQGFKVHDLVVA